MLPGVTGGLLASAYLERGAGDLLAEASAPRRRRGVRALAAARRRAARILGPASGLRAVLDVGVLPVLEALGFELLSLEARQGSCNGLVGLGGQPLAALGVLPSGTAPERAWRDLVRVARVAGVRWGLASDGGCLTAFDATRPWTRRALRCDLDVALSDERSAAVVWELLRADALLPQDGAPGIFERAIAASDGGTTLLCDALGRGVLNSLALLIDTLGPHCAGRGDRFEQALTIVYRLLFLLFAEARGLVPVWHPVYREAYTVGAMRERLVSDAGCQGLGEMLRAMSRLAHAGCRLGSLRVTAFNGPLFAPRRTPDAEARALPDEIVRDVVRSLATVPDGGGRRAAAYADLGVEQLGAMYERVLEFEPAADGRGVTRTSTARKTSASFYTPCAITRFLVRRTLGPLVAGRTAEEILALRVVDPAMGSGAFLVAACEFLARACEEARLDSGEWEPADATDAARQALRREIVTRCLFGVDRNPTAVHLARLSLWLATLAADRPLTFLDHHLVCGDSVIGARLADLDRLPGRRRPGRRDLPLFADEAATGMLAAVLPDRLRLLGPAATVAEVRDQERRHAALATRGSPLWQWRQAADIWTASWSDEAAGRGLTGDLIARALGRHAVLGASLAASHLERAADAARRTRPLHWELEFPEVFFDSAGHRRPDGGFDAVLGNPPWDMVRADTGGAEQRRAARDACRDELAFVRRSGVYRFQGGGQVNRYQVFVERALQVARPGARLGLILPGGFATDHGSADLRRLVLDATAVDTVAGFENRAGVFPIHRSMRFVLLVATAAQRTDRFTARFGLTGAEALDEWGERAGDDPVDDRRVTLSRELLTRWDPAGLVLPDLSSPRDLAIVDAAVRHVPRLGDTTGWGARFGRELNATDDRRLFGPRSGAGDLPVVEGKHLEPFRVHLTRAASWLAPGAAAARLPAGLWTRPRLAYRDVAGAGNRLTLIAALLPAHVVSTHTVFCLRTPLDEADQLCLLALLNSLAANYLVRRRVSVHVTTALMHALPIPRPPAGSHAHRRLVALARRLVAGGIEGAPDAWVKANSIAASLYRLTPDDYVHVVGTFPLIDSGLRGWCARDYTRRWTTAAR